MANASPAFNFDTTTCVVSGTAPGVVKILSGTRAYKGITGSFNVTLTTHVIGARAHGKCAGQNSQPLGGFIEVAGTGTVSVP